MNGEAHLNTDFVHTELKRHEMNQGKNIDEKLNVNTVEMNLFGGRLEAGG